MNLIINIGIYGASGKMGRRVISLIEKDPELNLSAAIVSKDNAQLGKKASDGVLFESISAERLKNIDVLIDFSLPHVIKDYVSLVRELRKPLVIGTTGLKDSELHELRGLAEGAPVVWAPNMSIGINVLRDLVQHAAKLLPETFDVHMTETHHTQKKDAPSGTAKQLAEDIRPLLKNSDIPIDCVRAGDVVGEHTVIFYGQGERIELTHRATSRDIFASGALNAAKWIVNKKPKFYSMKDVLNGSPGQAGG